MLAAAFVHVFLNPDFPSAPGSFEFALGMLIGFAVIIANQALTSRRYLARHVPESSGRWAVYPGQIAVSVVCVAISRFGHFVPGVIMGMSGDYEPRSSLELSQAARRVVQTVLSLAAISLTAWFASIPVAHAAARPHASSALLVLDAALSVLAVAGIESLVFGLVPLYFLPGDTLRRWRPRTWLAIWSAGVLWFALVVVDPALSEESQGGPCVDRMARIAAHRRSDDSDVYSGILYRWRL